MLHGVIKNCFDLVDRYVNDEITLEQFRSSYFDLYLNSMDIPDDVSFDVLDTLYAVLDLYTNDPILLRDNPELYLDEERVKEEVERVFEKLNQIKQSS